MLLEFASSRRHYDPLPSFLDEASSDSVTARFFLASFLLTGHPSPAESSWLGDEVMANEAHDSFDVIVAGSPGSGKTVFLAAMYDYLSTVRPDVGFFLSADSKNSPLLIREYARLKGREWPAPTEMENWQEIIFTVRVRTPSGTFDACQFRYYDYAGGHYNKESDRSSSGAMIAGDKLDTILRTADCILCLIDGEKVISALAPERRGKTQSEIDREVFDLEEFDLRIATDAIQSHSSDPIVHFLISKWDLIEQAGISFTALKTYLLKIPAFKLWIDNFVKVRNSDKTRATSVRLIPVSSVGKHYARISDSDVQILPDGRLEPYQVEMPLACIFPDRLRLIKDQVELELSEAEDIDTTVKVRSGFLWWKKIADGLSRASHRILPQNVIQGSGVQSILAALARPAARSRDEAAQRMRELENEKATLIADIKDKDDAFQAAVVSFHRLAEMLDSRYPESASL